MGFAPAIVSHPADVTRIAGNPVTFTTDVNGSSLITFQWQKDGADIAGATSPAYTIASVVEADGGVYKLVASSPFGSATSTGAVMASSN